MKFERVLVPLDGSRLAEASLPTAKALARRLGSVLVLVHAVEEDPPDEVHGETHLASTPDAESYLERQRDLCLKEGLAVEIYVAAAPEDEDVSDAIVQLAERFQADLVAMCAHGRQTLKGRFLGPIAQRAIRGGGPPIMLRTAGSRTDVPVDFRHILLPIDFRHDVELALDAVVPLATGFGASVTLIHAVDARSTGLPARMLPNTSIELSDRTQAAVRQRLTVLTDRLRAQQVDADCVVSTKDPDDAILDEAKARASDLIILVSHGRSGVRAWYERSVGQRLVQEPDLDLLLLRETHAFSHR